jgi:hypothetical protein
MMSSHSRLVNAPISPVATGDTSIYLLWRKNIFDSAYMDTINVIFINDKYCCVMNDAQKAAFAYAAMFIGNDCDWDGGMNEQGSNLHCLVPGVLGLGYQCSETQLNFLRQWFRSDSAALASLEECPIIPYTATIQTTFDRLIMNCSGDTIHMNARCTGINMEYGDSWTWEQSQTFLVKADAIFLIEVKKSKAIHMSMK